MSTIPTPAAAWLSGSDDELREVRLLRLQANSRRRDIVVGDLHGHRDALFRLLDKARFDPASDRVFCTGDLVDRGPDSMGCLSLLGEPWFWSVPGNHGQSLRAVLHLARAAHTAGQDQAKVVEAVRDLSAARQMGDEWIADHLSTLVGWERLMSELERPALPDILVVGHGDHRFHVVHAELRAACLGSDMAVDTVHHLPAGLHRQLAWSTALWDEMRSGKSASHGDHSYLFPTFCGHNLVPRVVSYRQHIFLDTGCGFSRRTDLGLTGLAVQTGECFFVPTE
jgi:serine/threonine protein phosphatase 1